jgi:hypothetical protein
LQQPAARHAPPRDGVLHRARHPAGHVQRAAGAQRPLAAAQGGGAPLPSASLRLSPLSVRWITNLQATGTLQALARSLTRCSTIQRWESQRIATLGISGGGSLTRPLRDARRFPSTRWYLVPDATRKTRVFGICPSFKGQFLCAPCQTRVTIRNLFIAGCACVTLDPRVCPSDHTPEHVGGRTGLCSPNDDAPVCLNKSSTRRKP